MGHVQERNEARTDGMENPGYSELSFVDALAHPHQVFANPRQVVDHPWFSDQEKRTILLSWVREPGQYMRKVIGEGPGWIDRIRAEIPRGTLRG